MTRRTAIAALVAVLALGAAACGSDPETMTTIGTLSEEPTGTESTEGEPTADSTTPSYPDPSVIYLQHALVDLGYDVDGIDGIYGQATTMAMTSFQTDRGLDATGHLDAETIAALEDESDEVEHLLVESLQTQLAELGHYTGTIDGIWGSGTASAVEAFQSEEGITATGTMDDVTFQRLVLTYDGDVAAGHRSAADATGDLPSAPTTVPEGAGAGYLQQGDDGAQVQALQERLAELGYRPGTPDGHLGAHTASAVLAFEEREGLERDAIVGPEVLSRLAAPQGAGPRSDAPGPRVEVDLDRQILFAIAADGTVTTINTSTGSGKEFQSAEAGKGIVVAHTPVGEFTILRMIDGLREAPLGTLYRPMYFTNEGGFAIHGNPHVPGYPASHGCARVANYDMDFLWDLGLDVGDPVWVYGDNPPMPNNAAGGF